MSKKNILFINGVPDNGEVEIHNIFKNRDMEWVTSGNTNIANFIHNDLFGCPMITLDTNPKQEVELKNIHAIFNQISDADTHKITLGKVANFYKSASGKAPFFNPPENIIKTTRDNIYRLLQGIDKLHVPKTVRIQPGSPAEIYDTIEKENFKFPVIFRQAGDHGGISTIRVEDRTKQFYAFPLDGRDYYLTQFVDYAEEDGLYAKYRLVVVEGEVFIRHAIFSDNWVIHSSSRKFMQKHNKYQTQEAAILESFETDIRPKIQDITKEIYHRLGLDYFGIDCNIDNKFNIILFEVNANMNIFTNTSTSSENIWNRQLTIISDAVKKMIIEKIKA